MNIFFNWIIQRDFRIFIIKFSNVERKSNEWEKLVSPQNSQITNSQTKLFLSISFAYNSDELHEQVSIVPSCFMRLRLIFHKSYTSLIDNILLNKARMPRQTIPLSLQFNWLNAPYFHHLSITGSCTPHLHEFRAPNTAHASRSCESINESFVWVLTFVCLQAISVFFHCPKYGKLAILLFVLFSRILYVFIFNYFSILCLRISVFFPQFCKIKKKKSFNAKLNRSST